MNKSFQNFLVACIMCLFTVTAYTQEKISGVLLTWVNDPSTTMVIDVHTLEDYTGKSEIAYRLVGESKWKIQNSQTFRFPFSKRNIHRVYLTNLKSGSIYEFSLADGEKVYQFKTMPNSIKKESIRFITGGDTMHDKAYLDATNKVALSYEPDFLVLGGDFAYANGLPENVNRWEQWFQSFQENMIGKDNRVVPIVGGIGNHEVQNGTYKKHEDFQDTPEWRKKIAPYFYAFFAFPGLQGYNVLDFGNYLSLIALDTEHTNPISGKQSEWLKNVLKKRSEKVDHIFPFYHIPAYPSHRAFDGFNSKLVRAHFVPIFEEYNIKVVFENHDHAYKRTYSLLKGKKVEDGKGIVYIGDGAWGVNTRPVNNEWYLEKAASVRHCIVVTLQEKNASFIMVDDTGKEFDKYQSKR